MKVAFAYFRCSTAALRAMQYYRPLVVRVEQLDCCVCVSVCQHDIIPTIWSLNKNLVRQFILTLCEFKVAGIKNVPFAAEIESEIPKTSSGDVEEKQAGILETVNK